jgi:hypothetical protein
MHSVCSSTCREAESGTVGDIAFRVNSDIQPSLTCDWQAMTSGEIRPMWAIAS